MTAPAHAATAAPAVPEVRVVATDDRTWTLTDLDGTVYELIRHNTWHTLYAEGGWSAELYVASLVSNCYQSRSPRVLYALEGIEMRRVGSGLSLETYRTSAALAAAVLTSIWTFDPVQVGNERHRELHELDARLRELEEVTDFIHYMEAHSPRPRSSSVYRAQQVRRTEILDHLAASGIGSTQAELLCQLIRSDVDIHVEDLVATAQAIFD